MRRKIILCLAGLLLAGLFVSAAPNRVVHRYIPLAIRESARLAALGINTITLPVPIAQGNKGYKAELGQGGVDYSYIIKYLCYPHSPVHNLGVYEPDIGHTIPTGKFLMGNKHWQPGKLAPVQTADVSFQAVFRDYLTVSVRRVDIWGYSAESICPQGEWIGSATAFNIGRFVNKNGTIVVNAWITADHTLFLQDYDPQILRVTHWRIDGIVDAIPLARQPDFRLGILLAPDMGISLPMNWWKFNPAIPNFINNDDWLIGEKVYIPFYTLASRCIPRTWEELFRDCITEFMMVDRGYIASAQVIEGKLGGPITITANLVKGSSGAPYLLLRPNSDSGINIKDFQLLAVENSGFGSGIGMGQRFTRDDYIRLAQFINNQLLSADLWTALQKPQTPSQKTP